ncbi:FecR family protein [Mangrovimonas sp. TPBH4]|uniref:FecR family protein n=1 Tax=Mangrovimonas sp. TPBH4 TaxID=1645914 RepID=UPI0006B63117|nr:FecR domain-containing protein [Mangrovimonas sp. TPBH4]
MEREDLIQKWLDHNLSEEEHEAFKKLDDYHALTQLDQSMKYFKAPEFNVGEAQTSVLKRIKSKKKKVINMPLVIMRIAAIFLVTFGIYYFYSSRDITVTTLAAEKSTISLPDKSLVTLNALTSLVYNKRQWKQKREVILDGEAFFKVAKGATFDVKTDLGTVTVYGTQFNVKERDNYFEVICYEGLVGVTYNNELTKLHPGEHFLIRNGKYIETDITQVPAPSWINNESYFKSTPYSEVISEFERQYNVTIQLQDIDTSQLFTGSFTHKNMDVALKSITLPLQLRFTKTANTITLIRE